ncbi:hypothetical protein GP486_001897 [Trichoglossum hirsutum]|uniref:DUF3074 domain-containing protein n=1 Tax=Trichoglossum hirsutum TaxID=265104 RepID=A0A9P8RS77_9PEZI|nr:hypothetical protein GP486_001897 [Trichoglossum hirsutum]
MAALHSALQRLAPVEWDSITQGDLEAYMKDIVSQTQLLVDSVPPPTVEDTTPITRPRSNTGASMASNSSEMYASSARSAPSDPTATLLHKEWGKPYRFAAKDNPLGMAVYKLAAKDGKGSWFARRSVHEGLGFSKWKKGLEAEFQETLGSQRFPGDGNVRGIGGEKLVERKVVDDVGKLEAYRVLLVYHLSAQFPGPTAPRDFVTLLISSSAALRSSPSFLTPELADINSRSPAPRHFALISKPCVHPNCPPREGFIRGQYESIEFIREIPLKQRSGSSSPNSPRKGRSRANSAATGGGAATRNTRKMNTFPVHSEASSNSLGGGSPRIGANANGTADGGAQEKKVSLGEPSREIVEREQANIHKKDNKNDSDAEDEFETNPVEWVMITRSDPGGSVPRWMVERGTPSSIIADAVKFLDWACQKEHPDSGSEEGDSVDHDHPHHHEGDGDHAWHTNSHLAGLGATEVSERGVSVLPGDGLAPVSGDAKEMPSVVTGAAVPGISAVTPAIVMNHLPGHRTPPEEKDTGGKQFDIQKQAAADTESDSDSSSLNSFITATGFAEGNGSCDEAESNYANSFITTSSANKDEMVGYEKELTKLNERKKRLDEQLAKTRARDEKRASEVTAKEAGRLTKAQEKHNREVSKQEEKYKREVQKLEAKKAKEARKAEERRKKQEEKDQKQKMQLERDEMKAELALLKKEREILIAQVGELQAENTVLTAKLGKLGGGNLVAELKNEVGRAGRLRARSLGNSGPTGRENMKEAVIQ